jgi:hypothetical protein
MKIGIFVIILILIFPLASAIELDMKKEYNRGETLLAKVSGNFINSVLKEKIKLYRGHVRSSLEPYVAKINDDFYIYASLLGKGENNYSLVIEDVKYYKGNEIIEGDIAGNFSITNETASFSAIPGFVVTDDDFYLQVQNLKDESIEINIGTGGISKESDESFFSSLFGGSEDEIEAGGSSVTLKSGEIEKINFDVREVERPHFEKIKLSSGETSYEIPVYVFGESEKKEEKKFRFEPDELNISLSTNSNTTRVLYLYNSGDDLENVSLSVSDSLKPYISVSKKNIDFFRDNSSEKIELSISSSEEGNFEGQISAESGGTYAYATVILNFIKDYIPPEDYTTKTCSEMNGQICSDNEECNGQSVYAKDNKCCLGTCKEIKESSAGKIIGWVMIILVASLLIWFYLKTKKKKR